MYKHFVGFLLFAVAAVLADPVLFNKEFFTLPHADFVHVHHVGHHFSGPNGPRLLRFMFLVPKVGALFPHGFATPGKGLTPKLVPNSEFDGTHGWLLDVVGFSDCKTWYGLAFGYLGVGGTLNYKVFTLTKGADGEFKGDYHVDLDHLADFVHGKTTSDVFEKLVDNGLASHPLTHKVHHLFFPHNPEHPHVA